MNAFVTHSIDTAPEQSGPGLRSAQQRLGFIPNMMGVLAESPAALDAYQALNGAFATSSFTAAEQQFLALVISVSNGCTYCVPVYTALAAKAGVSQQVIDAVRDGGAIADETLSALRDFALAVVEKKGWIAKEELETFMDAGFTKAQVLDVIVAAAFKLISNYTNHIADIPLDDVFKPLRWDGKKAA